MSGRDRRYCEQCGQRLSPGARQCDRCGVVQSPDPGGDQSPPQQRSPAGGDGRSGRRNRESGRRRGPADRQRESSSRQGRRGAQDSPPDRQHRRAQGGRRGRSGSGGSDNSTLLVVVGGLVLLGVLLLFVAPILATFVLGLGDTVEQSPRPADAEPAAEEFLVALADGDRQILRQHSASAGPVADQLDGTASGPAAELSGSEFTVVDVRVRSEGTERAVVDATLEPSGTESTTAVTLELRPENGEWVVWDISYSDTPARSSVSDTVTPSSEV